MDQDQEALWNWLNVRRNEAVHRNPYKDLQDAIEEGVEVGAKEASWYLQKTYATRRVCPPAVSEFIVEYLSDKQCTSVLDSFAGIGDVVVPIVDTLRPDIAIAVEQNSETIELSRSLYEGRSIQWVNANQEQYLEDLDRTFDVAICTPPWGMPKAKATIGTADDNIDLSDEAGNLLVLRTMRLLNAEGIGFALVAPSFLWSKNKYCVRQNLACFGLFVEAALSLPNGSFSPLTQIGGLLLVINREPHETLFVGELRMEQGANDALLANLNSKKNGRVIELGALVDPKEFSSFQAFVVGQEIDSLAKQLGLPKYFMKEISLEINQCKRSAEQGFEDNEDCFYFPTIGNSPAVTNLEELQIKQHNCVQVVLDSEKAVPAYVANFFNTDLGKKIRDSLTSGTIPRISKASLELAPIFLPEISTQTELLSLDTQINEMATQLDSLQRQLWNQPRKVADIRRSLGSLNRDDGFKSWIENLPFPLASILWMYLGEDSVEHKVDHLFHCFEALAEFLATVMLSALASDDEFFVEECKNCIEDDPGAFEKFSKASCGSWVVLGERLAKATRRLMSSNRATADRCLELFARPEAAFVEMVSNKDEYEILHDVLDCRNRWKGHGGVCSSVEMHKRLSVLEELLSGTRGIISERYEQSMMLAPVDSEYSDGIYNYRARLLRGYATPFARMSVQTRVPMDSRKLYILHEDQLQPLELLPFVQLGSSPTSEQNACYFYNRIEQDGARYVSYHFGDESEISGPNDVVEKVLEKFIRPSKPGQAA
jgi:hypothetical protein